MEQYKRVYAAIDLDAIEYNLKSIKNNISKDTKIGSYQNRCVRSRCSAGLHIK